MYGKFLNAFSLGMPLGVFSWFIVNAIFTRMNLYSKPFIQEVDPLQLLPTVIGLGVGLCVTSILYKWFTHADQKDKAQKNQLTQ